MIWLRRARRLLEESGLIVLRAARVAIAGLGLMGGSLALALRGKCVQLIGVEVDPATQAQARATGVVDQLLDLEAAAAHSDLLILAAPVRAILGQLQFLAGRPVPGRRVVMDLGSTKRDIVQAMQALPGGYDPVGGHPMCGKEVSGLRSAEAGLFRDKVFVLTPLARTSPAALALAREVVAAVGAHPL